MASRATRIFAPEMCSCSAVQLVLDGTCKHMVRQLGALMPRDGIFVTHPNIMEECGSQASWGTLRFQQHEVRMPTTLSALCFISMCLASILKHTQDNAYVRSLSATPCWFRAHAQQAQ